MSPIRQKLSIIANSIGIKQKNKTKGFAGLVELATTGEDIGTPWPQSPLTTTSQTSNSQAENTSELSQPEEGVGCLASVLAFFIILIILFIISYSVSDQDESSRGSYSPAASQYPTSQPYQAPSGSQSYQAPSRSESNQAPTPTQPYLMDAPSQLTNDHSKPPLPDEIYHTPDQFVRNGLKYTIPSNLSANMTNEELRWCSYQHYRIQSILVLGYVYSLDISKYPIIQYWSEICWITQNSHAPSDAIRQEMDSQKAAIVLETFRQAGLLTGYPWFTANHASMTNQEQIKNVQTGLLELGYKPGPSDGVAGRRTAAAIKAFQKDAGLPQDGLIDTNLVTLMDLARAAVKTNYP